MTIRVLLVAERGRDFTIIRDLLGETGLDVELDWTTTCDQAAGKLTHGAHDVVLATDRVGSHSATELFRLCGGAPAAPVLVLAAGDDEGQDDAMMAAGASDVLDREHLEPARLERAIRHAVWRALRVRGLHSRLDHVARVVELGTTALVYIGEGELVRFANRRFRDWLIGGAEATGLRLDQLLGDGYDRLRHGIETAARGHVVDLEAELPAPGGPARRMRIVNTPELDDRGTVIGMLLSFEDLSRPSETSGAGLAEERLHDFALAASEWLWETDEALRLRYLSNGADRLIGRRLDRLLGAPLPELGPDPVERLRRDMEAGNRVSDVVIAYSDERRQPRAMAISGYALRDPDGLLRGYRGIGRDVSDLYRSLPREIEVLEDLSGPVGANLTRQVFGQGPLDATVPEIFAELVSEYATELDRAIGQGSVDDDAAQDLARRLGYLRASARDAVKLHRTALERVIGAASPEQLRAGLDIGRLLLITVLLHLATYFRGGYAGDRPEPVAVAVRR